MSKNYSNRQWIVTVIAFILAMIIVYYGVSLAAWVHTTSCTKTLCGSFIKGGMTRIHVRGVLGLYTEKSVNKAHYPHFGWISGTLKHTKGLKIFRYRLLSLPWGEGTIFIAYNHKWQLVDINYSDQK